MKKTFLCNYSDIKSNDYDVKKVLKSSESNELIKWIKDSKCKCTFECATAASIVWNYKNIPQLLKASANSYIRDKKS